MTVLIQDTFTDTTGTLLTNHAPDVGAGSWGYTGAFRIRANRCEADGAFRQAYIDAGASNVTISCTLNFGVFTGTRQMGWVFRRTDASNYWLIWINMPASGTGATVNCQRTVAGSPTTLSGSPAINGTVDTDHEAVLTIDGTGLSLTIDGGAPVEFALTSDHLTATQHGFQVIGNGTNTTLGQFDDLLIESIAATTTRTLHPVLKIGSSHIGPMRVGERN